MQNPKLPIPIPESVKPVAQSPDQEGQGDKEAAAPGQFTVYYSESLPPLYSTWNHSSFRAMRDLSPIYPYPETSHPLQGFVPGPKNSGIRGMLGRWATCIALVLTQLILFLGTLIPGYFNFKLNSPISSAAYCLQPHVLFVLLCWLSVFLLHFLDSTQHFPSGLILSVDS